MCNVSITHSYVRQRIAGSISVCIYKPQHGSETALLKVKNYIVCALDNRKAIFVILLDLSAAFDTVEFEIFDKDSHNVLEFMEMLKAGYKQVITFFFFIICLLVSLFRRKMRTFF